MRIIIDMQGMQSKASGGRGVGRYTESLIKGILENNTKHEFYLALNGALSESIDTVRSKFAKHIDSDHIVVWQNYIDTSANKVPSKTCVEAAEILREIFFYAHEPDLIFSTNAQEGFMEPAVTSVKVVPDGKPLFCTTLHDLIPYHYKQYLSDSIISDWYYQKIKHALASDIILTVSNSSKKDITEILGVDPAKVTVIENGIEEDVFNTYQVSDAVKSNILSKYRISKPFIFYVGGNDAHKNIEKLIRAYASDDSTNNSVTLLLGGGYFPTDTYLQNLVHDLGLDGKVIFPGYIDEPDLPIFYKCCLCFAFPSTHEGFGLPVLEAMACGAPVIGSNSSSIKEIINNPAALFDPLDIVDIAKILRKAVFDRKFANELKNKGIEQAKEYSWSKSAKKLLAVFDELEIAIKRDEKIGINKFAADPIQATISSIAELAPPPKNCDLVKIAKSICDTFEVKRRPRLYLDFSVVVVQDDKSGIQRVVRAIATELMKLKQDSFDVEIVYTRVGDPRFFRASKYMQQTGVMKTVEADTQIEFNKNDVLIYLDLHPGIAVSHQGATKYLRNKGVKVYYVVYDILPLLRPETFWPELCNEFALWAESVSLTDGALCISKSVATELKEYLDKYGSKRAGKFNIGWFHLGADIENSIPSVGGVDEEAFFLLSKLKASQSFLMVGTVEPRKGHRQTLKAFELLWQDKFDINLVIVGRLGWEMDDFKSLLMSHPELGQRLFWLNGISDEYLEKIYNVSSCLLAASEGEGFGLPLIEAAKHGIPIIVRNIPVFKEVVGTHGHYFHNDNKPETLSASVREWLGLYSNNVHPLSAGIPCLTWKQSAEQLFAILKGDKWEFSIQALGAIQLGKARDFRCQRLGFQGFSGPEQEFRWTDGRESLISFNLAEALTASDIRILCGTYGCQNVKISINDNIAFEAMVEGETELIFTVEALQAGPNVVKFALPDAKQPDADDKRLVALSFRELEIIKYTQPLTSGEVIDFRSRRLNFRGFSGAEQSFRWTDGNLATIGFWWAATTGEAHVVVTCNTFGSKKIKASCNNKIVFDGEIAGDSGFVLNVDTLRYGYNILKFVLPDAMQPTLSDNRLLAFALRTLEIRASSEFDSRYRPAVPT